MPNSLIYAINFLTHYSLTTQVPCAFCRKTLEIRITVYGLLKIISFHGLCVSSYILKDKHLVLSFVCFNCLYLLCIYKHLVDKALSSYGDIVLQVHSAS